MTGNSENADVLSVDDASVEVNLDQYSFPVVDHGEGDPVLLLHGFPDSRHMWRYQVPALAEVGYRVIAPDLKGYGDAPKPQSVEEYDLFTISEEVLDILDQLGVDKTAVIGHDWGAALSWILTAFNQDRVNEMIVLSVGAPGLREQYTFGQFQRSWYVQFFQNENAEAWLLRNDAEMLREFVAPSPDRDRYLEALTQPETLTAGLNWYRANWEIPHPDEAEVAVPSIDLPVMGLWSEGDDFALREEWMKNSKRVVSGSWRYERISGASHWMMLDKPGEINRLMLDFLA